MSTSGIAESYGSEIPRFLGTATLMSIMAVEVYLAPAGTYPTSLSARTVIYFNVRGHCDWNKTKSQGSFYLK